MGKNRNLNDLKGLRRVPVKDRRRRRRSVFQRDKNTCQICGYVGTGLDDPKLTLDHIVSVRNGGSNKIVNLQCLCYDCNQLKGYRNGLSSRSSVSE